MTRPAARRRHPSIEPLEPRAYLASTTASFASAVSFAAGTTPVALAAGDFNGDGHEDLAVADATAEKVNVFFGTGTGTFTAGPVLSLSAPPTAILVGDFNGDGLPDIAVAASPGSAAAGTGSTVTVFLNSGGGNFALGQSTTILAGGGSDEPVAIAAGDFNGDGHLDLVATDYASSQVSVLLGTGSGTFGTPVTYNVGDDPTAVAVGDFNEDGHLDIAVAATLSASSGTAASGSSDGVLTVLGDGNGQFTTGSVTPLTASGSSSLAAGDLTGDGKAIDLAVGNDDGTVTLLVDNGSDAFTESADPAVAAAPTAVAIADVNLDGDDDVVTADGGAADSNGVDTVTVIPGAGTGTVAPAIPVTTSAVPEGLVVADFNGDGRPDLATANSQAGTVSVLLNTTTVTPLTTRTTLSVSPTSTPAGSTVTLSATVAGGSASPLTGESVPTGTVSFYDGTTLLNTVALTAVTGTATGTATASLEETALDVGSHKLYAKYVGDPAYAASGSAAAAETITATATSGPNLVATFTSVSLPATVAPGEAGTAKIKITNEGDTIAAGAITNALYLSLDTTLDGGDTPVPVKGSLAKTAVRLVPGASVTLSGTFTVPASTPLNGYVFLVQVDASGGVTQSSTAVGVTPSPTAYNVVDQFGTVGGKKGVTLAVTDESGRTGTFRLTGPGTGTVTVGDDGVDLSLAGTTAASGVTVTPASGGTFALHDLTTASAVGTIKAPAVAVTSAVSVDGSAGTVALGDVSGAAVLIGTVRSLSVAAFASGTLALDAAGTLTDAGAFGAEATAASINAVTIGGADTGTILTTGNVGAVLVRGNLTGATLTVGVGAATSRLASLRVLGSATGATVVVGATLAAHTLSTGGTLGSLTVAGPVDATSRFLAAAEPKRAVLGGAAVDPATDPRFSV